MSPDIAEQDERERAARDRGLDPLMERTTAELLRSIPKRFITMITKLLSMKGVAWGAWFYLVVRVLKAGGLESAGPLLYLFAGITLVLIFGEKVLQYWKDIKG